jgi:hypothetical protein
VSGSLDQEDAYRTFALIVNGPALFHAIVTASELRLFEFLADNPSATADEIRKFVELPEHKLRVLLQAVCATGLIEKDEGRFRNSPLAQELLASPDEASWRHILISWKEIYYPAFMHTTEALRSGRNVALDSHSGPEPTLYERLTHLPEVERRFHAGMAAFTLHTVPALIANADLANVRHLLDVGGGSGVVAARLAQHHQHLRVSVFDNPSVAGLTPTGGDDRLVRCPGNILADPFPTGADAILFSHVLEIYDEQEIIRLLRKAHAALDTGGTVFVYGFNVSDDERSGVFSARLSLYLNVLASGQGMAYPAGDYADWLRRAGFDDIEIHGDLPYEHALLTARKRSQS